mmetsp:Transcript_12064/g.18524  ORF Transcript_12064/g.18524 Transcript_12064/m.18524 type:complete len:260 (-) Transcript_12064:230-1009(-)
MSFSSFTFDRKEKFLLFKLLRSPMAALQNPPTTLRSGFNRYPGTQSARRYAPLNLSVESCEVAWFILPPPALVRIEPINASRFETEAGMESAGVESSSSSSSSDSSSSLLSTSPLVNTIETGSKPPQVSFTASTNRSTSSSDHSEPGDNTSSGIGCSPASQISLHISVIAELLASSRYASTLSISFPPKKDSITPSTPSTVCNCSKLLERSEVSVKEYTIGTGPGKFPLASSCSFPIGANASTVPSTNTALAFALVRRT